MVHTALPQNAIYLVAEAAGMHLHGIGTRRKLHCPLGRHTDHNASAVLFGEENRFHCSVCTPGRSLSLVEFARRSSCEHVLPGLVAKASEILATECTPSRTISAPRFTPESAQAIWSASLARARDDRFTDDPVDREAYTYLARRGLMEAWDECAFGILPPRAKTLAAVRSWARGGYTIVVPLYSNTTGEIVTIQARSVREDARPKTLFPRGASTSGAVFASRTALSVIRDAALQKDGAMQKRGATLKRRTNYERSAHQRSRAVILAEGLTDHLCLTFASPVPVVAAAGTGGAVRALGAWVNGCDLFVAVDCDRAGDSVVRDIAKRAFSEGVRTVTRLRWPERAQDACEARARLGTDALCDWLTQVTHNPN